MTIIHAATSDQLLVATIIPPIAENNIKAVRLHIDFDSTWDSFSGKSAVFTTSKNSLPYEAVLSAAGDCLIPHEVLAEESKLFITAKGVSPSGETKTTTRLVVKILNGTPAVIVSDPSPDVYKQLLSRHGETEKALAVERARINNLAKLTSGSTTGDAELLDMRVDIYGNTHETAGEAMRAQNSKLTENLELATNAIVKEPRFPYNYRWINEFGEIKDDNNYKTSEIMDLADCVAIKFKLYEYNKDNTHLSMIAYYDENLKHIESITAVANENKLVEMVVIPPTTAKYAVACIYRPLENQSYVRFYYAAHELNKSTEEVIDLCEAPTETGYIWATNGSLTADENWAHTGFIRVKSGKTLEISMYGHQSVRSIGFFNENKELIDSVVGSVSYLCGTSERMAYGKVIIPEKTAFVQLCYRLNANQESRCKYIADFIESMNEASEASQNIESLKSQMAALNQNADKVLKGKTVFLAGDSRSSTDYSFYRTNLEEKSGASVIVGGASGWKTSQIASNSYFERLKNYPHDFSLWLVGGNDIGASGTIGTFNSTSPNGQKGEAVVTETNISADYAGNTFIQAVDHIMRKYKSLYYDWKALNNGHKPKMIFCTDIPQKRSGGGSTWSLKENWERKRNAIIECAEKNNVALLDLYALCNFDMRYEPEWTSPTDKVNNNGLYFMDGLHPNKYGIDIITSLEIEEIKKYLTIY